MIRTRRIHLAPEGDEFIMMLRRFARKYSTRDIVEEYRNIPVCPLLDGWVVGMAMGTRHPFTRG
jgi:hypothetical protein